MVPILIVINFTFQRAFIPEKLYSVKRTYTDDMPRHFFKEFSRISKFDLSVISLYLIIHENL